MIATEPLWEAFDFENDKVDRLIMYEITKRMVAGYQIENDIDDYGVSLQNDL